AVAHQHAVPPRPSDPRGGEQQQLPALRSQPQHGWGHRYAKEPDDGEAVGASRSGGTVADHPAGHPAMTPRQTPRLNARSHWHRRLLRPRRERPHRSATEQRDELASPHSITSSASASSLSGIWTPSALAVLRLMISSNLVGTCTGRSAGFSPLRTRSIY